MMWYIIKLIQPITLKGEYRGVQVYEIHSRYFQKDEMFAYIKERGPGGIPLENIKEVIIKLEANIEMIPADDTGDMVLTFKTL